MDTHSGAAVHACECLFENLYVLPCEAGVPEVKFKALFDEPLLVARDTQWDH